MTAPNYRALNEDTSSSSADDDDSAEESSSTHSGGSSSISDAEEDASGESSGDDSPGLTPEAAEAAIQKQFHNALTLLIEGKKQEAQGELEELLSSAVFLENHGSPNLSAVRYSCYKNLGDIHRQQNDPTSAVDCYLKASRIDSTDITLWLTLGTESAKNGNFLLSRFAFEQGLKVDPESWRCLDKLISTLFVLGDTASCLFMIKDALNRDNDYVKGHIIKDEIFKFDPFLKEKGNANLFKEIQPVSYSSEERDKIIDPLLTLVKKQHEKDDAALVFEIKDPFVELKDYSWESLGECLVEQYNAMMRSQTPLIHPLNLIAWIKTEQAGQEAEMAESCEVAVEESASSEQSVPDAPVESAVRFVVSQQPDPLNISAAPLPSTPPKADHSSTADSGTDTTPGTAAASSADESEPCNIFSTGETPVHPNPDLFHRQKPSRGRKKQSSGRRKSDYAGSVYKRRSSRLVPGFQMEDDYLRVRRAPLPERIRECLPRSLTFKGKVDSPSIRSSEQSKSQESSQSQQREMDTGCVVSLVATKEDLEEFLRKNEGQGIHRILMNYLDTLQMKYMTHKWSERLKTAFVKAVQSWSRQEQLNTPLNVDVSKDRLQKCGLIRLIFLELVFLNPEGSNRTEDVKNLGEKLFPNVELMSSFQHEFGWSWLEYSCRVDWLRANVLKGEMQQVALLMCKRCLEMAEKDLVIPNLEIVLSVPVVERKLEQIEKATLLRKVHDVFDEGRYREVIEILKEPLCESEELSVLEDSNQQENRLERLTLLCSSFEAMGDFKNVVNWIREAFEFVVSKIRSVDFVERERWCEKMELIVGMLKNCMERDRRNFFVHSEELGDYLVKCIVIRSERKHLESRKLGDRVFDPWILLYEIAKQAELSQLSEDYLKSWFKMSDSLTVLLALRSLMLLRLAHEEFGSDKKCTEGDGRFLLFLVEEIQEAMKHPLIMKLLPSGCKDDMLNEAEQCFYCLYQYPNKRKRHLEEHSVRQIQLTWDRVPLVFDFLRPEDTPEFDGKRTDAVSADTVQMLHRIENLVPEGLKPDSFLEKMEKYLLGEEDEFWMGLGNEEPIIGFLYYLIGDYYQKNADFPRAIRYYSLDLCVWPHRFDSWGGLALARAGILQKFLQSVDLCICRRSQLALRNQTEKVLKCFQKAVQYQPGHLVLRMEFGAILYEVQGFFSRLKNRNEIRPVKEEAGRNQQEFLKKAEKVYSDLLADNLSELDERRERWLLHYMYGKILEKLGSAPDKVLPHYLRSAHCLYADGAKYREKIKYEYPTHFELETLELHYRVHASVLKWIEKGRFSKKLPLMRRYVRMFREHGVCRNEYSKRSELRKQRLKVEPEVTECVEKMLDLVCDASGGSFSKTVFPCYPEVAEVVSGLTERVAMEEEVVSLCCDAMRLCIKRFFNHYKAYYRLAMAYFKIPSVLNVEKARLVLLGPAHNLKKNERIAMCLFQGRKSSCLFEGVFRILHDDIDRNGSFNAHMLRAVELTLGVLKAGRNYNQMLEICLQLAKKPEKEKQFLCDEDRLILCQRAAEGTLKLRKEAVEDGRKKGNARAVVRQLFPESVKAYNLLSRHKDIRIDTLAWKSLLKEFYVTITQEELNPGTSDAAVFRYFDDLAARLERERTTAQSTDHDGDRRNIIGSNIRSRKRSSSHWSSVASGNTPLMKKPYPVPVPTSGPMLDHQLIAMLEAQLAFIRSGGSVKDSAGMMAKNIATKNQLELIRGALGIQTKPLSSGLNLTPHLSKAVPKTAKRSSSNAMSHSSKPDTVTTKPSSLSVKNLISSKQQDPSTGQKVVPAGNNWMPSDSSFSVWTPQRKERNSSMEMEGSVTSTSPVVGQPMHQKINPHHELGTRQQISVSHGSLIQKSPYSQQSVETQPCQTRTNPETATETCRLSSYEPMDLSLAVSDSSRQGSVLVSNPAYARNKGDCLTDVRKRDHKFHASGQSAKKQLYRPYNIPDRGNQHHRETLQVHSVKSLNPPIVALPSGGAGRTLLGSFRDGDGMRFSGNIGTEQKILPHAKKSIQNKKPGTDKNPIRID